MVWLLLVVMQLKHFIADYPLQGKYMLGKFKALGWELPLAAHCAVHGLFTTIISLSVGASFELAAKLALFDFTIHFIMDRVKASPVFLGKYKALSANEMIPILTRQSRGYDNSDIMEEICEKKGIDIKAVDSQLLKNNTYFWYSLGLDQMVHHLTDLFIVYVLVSLVA